MNYMRSLFLIAPALLAACTGGPQAGETSSSTGTGTTSSTTPVGLGSPPRTEDALSGTRLKARYYQSGDGARQFIGWFDSQRNVPCLFCMADSLRCLPAVSVQSRDAFADGACSQSALPAAVPPCTNPAPTEMTVFRPQTLAALTCASDIRAVSVGALVPPPTPIFFKDADGGCMQSASNPFGFYPVTGEIPLTDYAAATVMTDP